MIDSNEMRRQEYAALMDRCREIEKTSSICWMAAGATAAVLLSWSIGAENPGLMLPAIIAVAIGLNVLLHGSRKVRLIAGYVEEFHEGSGGGAGWFSRLAGMRMVPGTGMSTEWLATGVANAIVVIATTFAWIYAGPASHGELMAGIETGLALVFAFHSITETSKLGQTDFAALWRRADRDQRESARAA